MPKTAIRPTTDADQTWRFPSSNPRGSPELIRCADSQVLTILKPAGSGTPVPQFCREHGTGSTTFYMGRGAMCIAAAAVCLGQLPRERRRAAAPCSH